VNKFANSPHYVLYSLIKFYNNKDEKRKDKWIEVFTMIFNIAVGFILPWIVVAYLLRKQKKFIILFYPISALISFFINDIGFVYFWELHQFNATALPALPYNLGLFPLLGCLFIFVIHIKRLSLPITLLLFVFFTTIAEFFMVFIGKIIYKNGWNIAWTFLSYLFAYGIVYLYYKISYKLMSG